MLKHTTILLALFFVFIQCKKKKLPYCEEFPCNCVEITTIKDHFYFDVGTYWIYEEENSGQIDSQWVSVAHTKPNVSWFNYTIKSSIMSHYFFIETDLLAHAIDSGLVRKDKRSILISRSKTKPGGFIGTSYLAEFYYHTGDSIYNYGGAYGYDNLLRTVNIFESFSVSELSFTNVIKMSEDHNVAESNQKTNHFYAQEVGLIRKELLDSNQVWNLIRYNIIK